MISWIQHHLIRHGRWIFLTLLAIIIVAFVFTIGNTPGCTTDRSGYQEQLFYGIDLNSPRESQIIAEKVQLSAFLNGQQFRSNDQFQSQMTNRIAMLHLADEIGVPSPDEQTLADYITTQAAFRGIDGEFSADLYTAFVDQIESNPQTPQGLALLVLEENYRINQVGSVLSGPGYLLPSEALAQTQRDRTSLTLFTAELSYEEFSPEAEASEEALKAYFETNQLRYEIPERIQASYVFFENSQFANQIPDVSEAELREHFIANRAQFVAEFEANRPAPEEGEEAAEEEAPVTFEDVRESVTASLTLDLQSRVANEAAQAFAYTLYRDSIELDSAAFNQLLNESGVSLIEIEPFTAASARQRALSPEMLESAFNLGGNRYYSDAYQLSEGFGVLIYKGRIPSEIPELESVKDEVTESYLAEEKRRLFNEKGESLKSELEGQISEGATFTEAAEALGLTPTSYETFEVKDAPFELNRSALEQAQGMQGGEVSPMLTTGPTGIFVFVEDKVVPEIAVDDEELTQAEDFLIRYSSYTSGASFSNELVFRGLPEDALDTEE